MSDIFISYKREDKNKAKLLATKLIASGWSVWWDHDLLGGDDYDVVIERELAKAKAVIVIWSPLSVNSRNVKDEAKKALSREILVPISFDNTEPPIGFGMTHVINISSSYRISDDEFSKLYQSILEKAKNPIRPIIPPKPSYKKYYILSTVIILSVAFYFIFQWSQRNSYEKSQLTEEQQKIGEYKKRAAEWARKHNRPAQAIGLYREAQKIMGNDPEILKAIDDIQKQIGGNSQ